MPMRKGWRFLPRPERWGLRARLVMKTLDQSATTTVGAATAGSAQRERWLLYGEIALGVGALVLMPVAIWAALVYAPTDAVQGDVQRIIYVHVPLAILPYVAFFVVFVASILYLWRRDERWDTLAHASAEVGVVFTTLMLVVGMLWGQGFWGRPWDWADPRLTTTFILWLIYVSYLLLRFYTGRSESGARLAAVLGIAGFVDVPIVHFAVTWWRSVHPDTDYLVNSNGSSALPPAATFALLLSFAVFTLLYVLLVIQVYRLLSARTAALRLRARVEDATSES
jgi:heme exporter protein C